MNNTLGHIQQQVQRDIDVGFTQYINQLPDHADYLKQAMSYALLSGGKRIRPLLVRLVGELFGANSDDIQTCGLAIEATHTFSLIHDDLPAMDDDNLRRGKPTCHVAFDEATAILAGDALQAMSVEILSSYTLTPNANINRISLIKALVNATGYHGLCGGQSMDILATGKSIPQSDLEALHFRKTGVLIQAAVRMGYLIANVQDQTICDTLDKYAQNLGLAFQVIDDILDLTSDTQTLGKPQGSDVARGKSTYPSLLGVDGAKAYAKELGHKALQGLETLPYDTETLLQFSHYILDRDY